MDDNIVKDGDFVILRLLDKDKYLVKVSSERFFDGFK